MKTDEVIKRVERECTIRGFSSATSECYTRYAEEFLNNTHQEYGEEYTIERFKAYVAEQIKKGHKPATVNLKINAVKFLLGEVLDIPINLRKIHSLRQGNVIADALSEDELHQFFEQKMPRRHQLAFMLMAGTGLRVQEVAELTVQQLKSGIVRGKGNKERRVVYSKRAVNLASYLLSHRKKSHQDSPFLFSKPDGGHVLKDTFQKYVKIYAKRAGLQRRVHCHLLRKTYGSMMVSRGTDSRIIQEILGHKSANTTARYTHIQSGVYDKLTSPIDK